MRTMIALIAIVLMVSIAERLESAVDWTVFLRRAGPIRVGMSVSEVRRTINDLQAFLAYADREPDESECAYLRSPEVPQSPRFMFQKGRLVRIDVNEPGIRTASGAGVGDTENKIKRLYSTHITVEPHHYLPEKGHYLIYSPADRSDSGYGMVFETDGARVTSFRTGTRAAIALVEGCS